MDDGRSMRWQKTCVFFLTFFSYVMFHVSRKSFSAVKGEMSKEEWMESIFYAPTEQAKMYGLMDTLFMAFYAVGLYISGILGDRYDLRKLLAGGMGLTALLMVGFGLAAFANVHSLGFYAFLWALNGLIQSLGWPSNVAIMGNWFSARERGAVMGIWSGNACFGNIVGTAVIALLFSIIPNKTDAWRASMIAAGLLVALHTLLIWLYLEPSPTNKRLSSDDAEDAQNLLLKDDVPTPKGISFWRAWRIPGVIPYALSYACVKSVNYALFFWVPFYLTVSLKMEDSTADYFSMLYDVGQIIGGFLGGYVTDKMGMRTPTIVFMLLVVTCLLPSFNGASRDTTGVLLFVSGFLLGGPANLISTAISADLGTCPTLRGNTAALATVTGIIDGTGSVGAAIIQYLVGYLANCHKSEAGTQECSWKPVFALLEIGGIFSCLFLTPLLYKELNRHFRGT
ncbi:sugar phosphate exchanger [Thraustotheca clavata]|uniref:Sugar phosphate exchanger n=1 Tax=Thraustotheca clavata TaxID=74557 RepID=A0A1V9ZQX0_9STRA|nr:sugar phosphate exchanger [Thraustotheca clavata]